MLGARGKSGYGARLGTRALACLCAAAIAFAGLPASSLADEAEENLNPEYVEVLNRLESYSDEYVALAERQDATYSQLEGVWAEIADIEARISDVEQEIQDRQADLEEKQEYLGDHISASYKSGGVNLLAIVLTSTSFEQAISRMYYYGAIAQSEADAINQINTEREELQSRQAELKELEADLHEQEADLETLYEQQRSQTEDMRALQEETSELLSSIPREVEPLLGEESAEILGQAQMVAEDQEGSKPDEDNDAADETKNEDGQAKDSGQDPAATNPDANNDPAQSTPQQETPAPTPGTSGLLQAVLDSAYSSGPPAEAGARGWGCSGYVYFVFKSVGIDAPTYNAALYTDTYCFSSNRADLKPGMIIGVTTHSRSSAGAINGHVGIYVGNGIVRDFGTSGVQETPIDSWIAFYGTTVAPRWGWYGGVALS